MNLRRGLCRTKKLHACEKVARASAMVAASFLGMLQPAHPAAESIQTPTVDLTVLNNSGEFPAADLADQSKLMKFSLRAQY